MTINIHNKQPVRFIKIKDVIHLTALSHSVIYEHINSGLMTPPIKISTRSVAWPLHEIDIINKARLRGDSVESIVKIVSNLIAVRANSSVNYESK